jgi:hypothetical protein
MMFGWEDGMVADNGERLGRDFRAPKDNIGTQIRSNSSFFHDRVGALDAHAQ